MTRAAEIKEIGTYIPRQQNTVVQYIATCTILELFLDMESRPVSQAPK